MSAPLDPALAALDTYCTYCARKGVRPDHEVIVRIREGIAARQGQPGGWRMLLDEAMDEAGGSINWDGDTIRDMIVWGEPARRAR
jgi:hypothetical protein